jgi:hypothetical protein
MAGHQAAARASLALEATTGKKGLGASRQAGGAKEGDGVGHVPILGPTGIRRNYTFAPIEALAGPALEENPLHTKAIRP